MGIERDEFYVGERALFDVDVTVATAYASAAACVLTIQLPDGTDVTPPVTVGPFYHAHAEFTTEQAGWHEWRIASTGSGGDGTLTPDSPPLTPDGPTLTPDGAAGETPVAARQGRFRVVPVNV